jgi:hypothetical protein
VLWRRYRQYYVSCRHALLNKSLLFYFAQRFSKLTCATLHHSPVYGEYGFKSASDIYERAKSLHIHNHPIHKDIFETEITPALPLMNSFFKRSIIDLQNILGNFILQKIQASKISQELSVEAKSRMDDMKDAFTRLEALATNRTGDWEDVVDLLSTLHTIVF